MFHKLFFSFDQISHYSMIISSLTMLHVLQCSSVNSISVSFIGPFKRCYSDWNFVLAEIPPEFEVLSSKNENYEAQHYLCQKRCSWHWTESQKTWLKNKTYHINPALLLTSAAKQPYFKSRIQNKTPKIIKADTPCLIELHLHPIFLSSTWKKDSASPML